MDIDKFLDKEIQAIKKEEVIKEQTVTKWTGEVKDISKPETIPEEAGRFASLEKDFLDLWERISKEKLNWNSELYTDIDKSGNEIKETLRKLSPKIRSGKNTIKGLISRVGQALDNSNYEDALKLYSEIIDIRNNIPDIFPEDKREFNEEIFKLYASLHEQIDLKFITDFKESISRVDALVRDSMKKLEAGNIEDAKKVYERALEVYKNLPHGFLLQKINSGKALLSLYRELSIHAQIKNLQHQLTGIESSRSYKYHGSYEQLERLSEITYQNKETRIKKHTKTLFSRLIDRKLERAGTNLEKGFYVDAKKNIESVLKLDPDNKDAKRMLNKIPA